MLGSSQLIGAPVDTEDTMPRKRRLSSEGDEGAEGPGSGPPFGKPEQHKPVVSAHIGAMVSPLGSGPFAGEPADPTSG
eukprot:2384344-Pyramimonas_sp.AAC.1